MWQDSGAVGFFSGESYHGVSTGTRRWMALTGMVWGGDSGIVVGAAGRMDGMKGNEATAVAKVFVPQFKR